MQLIALLFALSAHADVSNFDIVKSQDGKTVVCETNADIGRTGYRPLITTIAVDGTSLKLNTAVATLVCASDRGKLAFTTRLPYDPIPGKDYDDRATLEYMSQIKYLVVDSSEQIIGSIDATNAFMQALEYRFPVTSSFSREDLDRLARGETLHVRWEFFLQATHAIHRGSEVIPLGLTTGGSYNLSFDLTQSGGRYSVSSVRLR